MTWLWNESEQRLRSGWRIVLFQALVWGLLFGPVSWLAPGISGWLATKGAIGLSIAGSYIYIVLPLVMLGLLAVVAHRIDRRGLAERGFPMGRRWWLDLAIGAAVALAAAGLIFLIERTSGLIAVTGYLARPEGVPFALALTLSLLQFMGVGLWEEIWFRAHLIPNLRHGLGDPLSPAAATALTLVLGGTYFGLAHISNQNASLGSVVPLCVAGAFLGWLYLRTGSLAMPVGFHAAWDIGLGPVFGFPVSGDSDDIPKLIAVANRGADLWTGGAFGPENGLVGWLVVPLAFALLAWRATVEPPRLAS